MTAETGAPAPLDKPEEVTPFPEPERLHLEMPVDVRNTSLVVLAILASLFVLHWAKAVFIPVMLSVLFSYALSPPINWLEDKHVPRWLSSAVLLLAIVGSINWGAYSLRLQASQLLTALPEAAQKLGDAMKPARGKPESALESVQKAATKIEQAASEGARYKLVFTDGVFSMDGTVAQLDAIRVLCDRYQALLGVDECHASGFMGATGRGTHEHRGVFGKIDIITGTLGKALGGASGGFTSARREVVELLRQRSRPYLFSNTVAPSIVGGSIAVLDLLEGSTALRDKLADNTQYFRAEITRAGFDIKPGDHPIVPIMVYDAEHAQKLAARMLELGIYVVGFFFPVVPKGQARIRVQISAVHERADLDRAVAAFAQAGRELGLLNLASR